MKEKKYFRECPECNKKLGYTTVYRRDRANKKNSICISCENRKKPPVSVEERKKRRIRMINWHKNVGFTDEQKLKISKTETGKIVSKETIEKLRISHLGQKVSKETRKKLSIAGKKAWHEGKFDKMVQQTKSKSSQKFLDLIEDNLNIKFDKREFYLDEKYYDAKYKNILIEVDSKYWHNLPKQVENDKLKTKIALKNKYKLYRFEVNTENDALKIFNKNEKLIRNIIRGN